MLPFDLRWEIEPAFCHVDGDFVSVVAAGSTDYFIDPAGDVAVLNGARALAPAPQANWQFSARVRVDFRATYDAGVLMLYADDRNWAKLCFEQSPQGKPMVVSVVTREVSDDAHAWVIDGDTVWLRISRLERSTGHAYAFHAGDDGKAWHFVRYFALPGTELMRVGLEVQSPTGSGCSATFAAVSFAETELADLRDGS